MFNSIVWTLLLTICTVGLHILGTILLVNSLHKQTSYSDHRHWHRSNVLLLIRIAALLLVLQGLEALLWALFFLWKGSLPDFEAALYFSLTSYSTIGYGDLVLPAGVRLVGVMEGLVGTFMSGWSVALLVALIHNMAQSAKRMPE